MNVFTRLQSRTVAVVFMAMGMLSHAARRLHGRARNITVAFAAFVTVSVAMGAPASASAPSAFDDCTIAEGLMRPIKLTIKSAENVADVAWPAFLLVGLLAAAAGLAAGGAHRGIRIALGGLALLFVVWALLPAIGYNPGCTPSITVN